MPMRMRKYQRAWPPASPVTVDLKRGRMAGRVVKEVRRTLKDIAPIFADAQALAELPARRVVYRVQTWLPVAEGTRGGLAYGVTFIEPGDVGGECFMTKGHFHQRRAAAEFYWTYQGRGLLLMMDERRRCRAERMVPGSLHYVPGGTAHRTVNVGDEVLSFGACWPADAGHDYKTIEREGFSVRIYRKGGKVRVVNVC